MRRGKKKDWVRKCMYIWRWRVQLRPRVMPRKTWLKAVEDDMRHALEEEDCGGHVGTRFSWSCPGILPRMGRPLNEVCSVI